MSFPDLYTELAGLWYVSTWDETVAAFRSRRSETDAAYQRSLPPYKRRENWLKYLNGLASDPVRKADRLAKRRVYQANYKARKASAADAETRLAVLREDLGVPASALGPQMLAARDEERGR